MSVTNVRAWEVLDSRGFPTVEAEVTVDGRYVGLAVVPSGASKGSHEALELRDGGRRWMGKGVAKAVENIEKIIAPAIKGLPADQLTIDKSMIELDGTKNKSRLGANAVLAVSLAAARAISAHKHVTLYRHVYELVQPACMTMPLPMVNMVSGGLHASWRIDFQDFLIIPVSAKSYREGLEMVGMVYHCLRQILLRKGESVLLADEGGFSPLCRNNEEPLELVLQAVEEAGFSRRDLAPAIDVAATHLHENGGYVLRREKRTLSSEQLVDYLTDLCERYRVVSLEDGCAEDDWAGWRMLSESLGGKIQLVGDDLFTTNVDRLKKGAEAGVANAVLIKPNQIGTLTETIEAIKLANSLQYVPIVSARSGDSEDSFIADFAVGSGVTQIKIGSVARSERTCKYNRLLRIEDELGPSAKYFGKYSLKHHGGAVEGP